MVSFEDLRRIPPFMDVRLDELDGVLESQASSREKNLIVAKSAHRQFCRNANVKQRQMYELAVAYFVSRTETQVCTAYSSYRTPGWEDGFAF